MTGPGPLPEALARSSGDDPSAYVAEDRRRALVGGPPVDGVVSGSVLFADVSGFTAMTEALVTELGEPRGAEVLAAVLEQVFGELIGELHRWCGSVLYFSGDAVTCWFEGDDGRQALGCAREMQQVMDRVGLVRTPGGAERRLRVKVAVATGQVHRFLTGDPAVQLIDVLAGALMDEVAAAESVAEPGDVVVTEPVRRALGDLAVAEVRVVADGAAVTVVDRTSGGSAWGLRDPDPPPPPALPEEESRHWLLPPVYERLRAGRGELLAELRPAVPFFVRFAGADFEADPSAAERLDAFVVAVQRVVDGYGGNLLQLTVGDKGAYLYAVFGSPLAHEDDAARACAAALEVVDLRDGDMEAVTVGVASGRLRSGTYGHRDRRTFCCLGDAVNLAARLMAKAEPGTVLVSAAVARAAGEQFEHGERHRVALKGRAQETEAVRLLSRRDPVPGDVTGTTSLLVGRELEVQRICSALGRATRPGDEGPYVATVSAPVGAGKSRLVGEVLNRLAADGVRTLAATAPTRGGVAPYSGWWPLWRRLLDVPDDSQRLDGATLLQHLQDLLPIELHPRLPLLGALLGAELPETELSAALEAKLRKSSLEQLAGVVLALRVAEQPTVLAIDDAHGLGQLSRELLVEVVRAAQHLTVAVLLAFRPGEEPLLGLGPQLQDHVVEVSLERLDPTSATEMARQLLQELMAQTPERGVVDLVVARADGNPLWIRELCRFVHDQAATQQDATRPVRADLSDSLPDTLQGLVLGRLDLLPETPRRTAKVACVVGRRFRGRLVHQAWPDLGSSRDVRAALQHLSRRDIATPEDLTDDSWQFTHAVLRDVAYESVPVAVRARVHDAVVGVLEAGDPHDVRRHVAELAHHSWHGTDTTRKKRWLLAAGEAAQEVYAHDSALLSFRRLLSVLPSAERGPVHVRVGRILELRGEWAEAAAAYDAAAHEAGHDDPGTAAWATTWAADVARKRGHYDRAQALLDQAQAGFAGLGDEAGAAQVWHFAGTLAAQQGRFEEARVRYGHSLAIRQDLGDQDGLAALLSNLAVVAEYEGDYEEAGELGERALALRRELGDRWAVGVSQNNLGVLATLRGRPEEARERFAESLRLHQEVGDTWMVALGRHNLGNAHRDLREIPDALHRYAEALSAYRRLDDDWALAALYEDVALLHAATGRVADAWRLVGASDALHERTGSPRAPDVSARLTDTLGPGPAASTDEERWRTQGAALDPHDLDALVAGR